LELRLRGEASKDLTKQERIANISLFAFSGDESEEELDEQEKPVTDYQHAGNVKKLTNQHNITIGCVLQMHFMLHAKLKYEDTISPDINVCTPSFFFFPLSLSLLFLSTLFSTLLSLCFFLSLFLSLIFCMDRNPKLTSIGCIETKGTSSHTPFPSSPKSILMWIVQSRRIPINSWQ
jgi:hypothetical protein